jgi:hypothetical protein
MSKRTVYRDSGTGRIISKPDAERRPSNTWEKERVNTGKKK